jgi:hypothetical protein
MEQPPCPGGALANLGHDLSDTSVGNILQAHGIEPAPERRRNSSCLRSPTGFVGGTVDRKRREGTLDRGTRPTNVVLQPPAGATVSEEQL